MVFVTGGTGFLGAYIIQNLVSKGVAVRALRRSATLPQFIPAWVFEKVEWVSGDVLDVVALEEAMQGIEAVIHSAAVVSYHAADRAQLYQTNVDGTTNVVNAALDAGVSRFIHISSIAALGRTGKNATVTENQKWEDNAANTHYGISKHLAELEVWRGFAEGLQGVIVNPSLILGYGNWQQSSSAIFKTVYDGFPWYSEGVNGFVGVADVAEAVVQLLQSTLHQKRFIVSAENKSFRSVFNAIADGFAVKKPHRKATPFLGELAWRAEAVKGFLTSTKPLLTKESARNAHAKTHYENSALLQALPNFTFTPINAVIKNACTAYVQALQLAKS